MSAMWVDAALQAWRARVPRAIGTAPVRLLLPAWPFAVLALWLLITLFGPLVTRAPQPEVAVLGAVGAAPALLARTRPLLAGLGCVAVNAAVLGTWLAWGAPAAVLPWFPASGIAQLLAAYTIGLALAPRAAAVTTTALAVTGAAIQATTRVEGGGPLVAAVAFAALAALVGVLGSRRAEGHARVLSALQEEEQHRVVDERARIARELHDVVAHHMSALAVRAASAPHRIDGVPDGARAEFAELAAGARAALGELRQLLGVLRGTADADLEPQPGLDDVGAVAERTRRAGTPVELDVDVPVAVPPAVAVSAYRIVQEALSNVTRHATGAPTRVRIAATEDRITVRVVNAAPADPPTPTRPGHGLAGMRERARLLGGRFEAGATPDGGFAVHAELPYGP